MTDKTADNILAKHEQILLMQTSLWSTADLFNSSEQFFFWRKSFPGGWIEKVVFSTFKNIYDYFIFSGLILWKVYDEWNSTFFSDLHLWAIFCQK